MPQKKSEEPENSTADADLERRVAEMMGEADTAREPLAEASETPKPPGPPSIDIFKDPVTAPKVTESLLQEIGAEPATETPETPSKAQPPELEAPADIEDESVEKAVDDITAAESDALLAVQDLSALRASNPSSPSYKTRLMRLLKNKKLWITVATLLVITFGVPVTRYKVLGLVIKQNLAVTVIDSTTGTKVSAAAVRVANINAKTNASGVATLRVPVGPNTVTITKQYYRPYSQKIATGFKSSSSLQAKVVATGRQVPIVVTNKITGKPVSGAEIKILDTTAETNKQGHANIVLPASAVSDSATITAPGFNNASVSVKVTANVVPENTFALVPAGTVYFLSNQSGKIDLVKSNLDGSGRQTVLAGTGNEEGNSTSLLASRDWRYVVYKVRRETPKPALYVIDTSNDKVVEFDSGDADFTLVGWYGHSFIYDVLHTATAASQTGREALKSYNAELGQLNLLDQSQAEGSGVSYAGQSFYNFYILDNLLVYNTQWASYDNSGKAYDFGSKTNAIRGIQPNGQNKKDYHTFPVNGSGYVQAALAQPQEIYYGAYNYLENKTSYYQFDGQNVKEANDLNQGTFSKAYPTYLLSPSGNQTFWTELRDGKNMLFLGNNNAQNAKQIATLSDYTPYGWYGDNYLLISKNGSELYIVPASGFGTNQAPLKLTDYYKSPQTYYGYGYGYGGL